MIEGVRVDGKVLVEGEDIYSPGVNLELLRKRVGMVFQKYNPFPKSIYDNVAYGLRVQGIRDKDTERRRRIPRLDSNSRPVQVEGIGLHGLVDPGRCRFLKGKIGDNPSGGP